LIVMEETGVRTLEHYAYSVAGFQLVYVIARNVATLQVLGDILSVTEKMKQLGINVLALAVMISGLAWRFI